MTSPTQASLDWDSVIEHIAWLADGRRHTDNRDVRYQLARGRAWCMKADSEIPGKFRIALTGAGHDVVAKWSREKALQTQASSTILSHDTAMTAEIHKM